MLVYTYAFVLVETPIKTVPVQPFFIVVVARSLIILDARDGGDQKQHLELFYH